MPATLLAPETVESAEFGQHFDAAPFHTSGLVIAKARAYAAKEGYAGDPEMIAKIIHAHLVAMVDALDRDNASLRNQINGQA